MFWNRRKKPADPAPRLAPMWDEFGNGPFHIGFGVHSIPGDQWTALRATYDTEALPKVQLSGPTFWNRTHIQTIRRPGEVGAVIQATGIQDIAAQGINTGMSRSSPLTNINSTPGGIPSVAQGNFTLPDVPLA